jgi:hypothetical protein
MPNDHDYELPASEQVLRRGTPMDGNSLPCGEPSRAERLPLELQRPNVKLKLLRLATLAAVTVLATVSEGVDAQRGLDGISAPGERVLTSR